jgi:amphi-Trp domain-containing protein
MSDKPHQQRRRDDELEFSHDALIDTGAVAQYLRALADAFDNKTVRFSDRRGEMQLHPSGLVRFDVQAHTDGDRARVEVQFEWQEGAGDSDGELHIESKDRKKADDKA